MKPSTRRKNKKWRERYGKIIQRLKRKGYDVSKPIWGGV